MSFYCFINHNLIYLIFLSVALPVHQSWCIHVSMHWGADLCHRTFPRQQWRADWRSTGENKGSYTTLQTSEPTITLIPLPLKIFYNAPRVGADTMWGRRKRNKASLSWVWLSGTARTSVEISGQRLPKHFTKGQSGALPGSQVSVVWEVVMKTVGLVGLTTSKT